MHNPASQAVENGRQRKPTEPSHIHNPQRGSCTRDELAAVLLHDSLQDVQTGRPRNPSFVKRRSSFVTALLWES